MRYRREISNIYAGLYDFSMAFSISSVMMYVIERRASSLCMVCGSKKYLENSSSSGGTWVRKVCKMCMRSHLVRSGRYPYPHGRMTETHPGHAIVDLDEISAEHQHIIWGHDRQVIVQTDRKGISYLDLNSLDKLRKRYRTECATQPFYRPRDDQADIVAPFVSPAEEVVVDGIEIPRGFVDRGVYLRDGPTGVQRINNALSVPEANDYDECLVYFSQKIDTYEPSAHAVAPSSTSIFLYSGIAESRG